LWEHVARRATGIPAAVGIIATALLVTIKSMAACLAIAKPENTFRRPAHVPASPRYWAVMAIDLRLRIPLLRKTANFLLLALSSAPLCLAKYQRQQTWMMTART